MQPSDCSQAQCRIWKARAAILFSVADSAHQATPDLLNFGDTQSRKSCFPGTMRASQSGGKRKAADLRASATRRAARDIPALALAALKVYFPWLPANT